MLRSWSGGFVALLCGALSFAVVAIAPTQARAQKSQPRKAPAKQKNPAAPAKKPGAPRTQPAASADAAADTTSAAQPQPAADEGDTPTPPAKKPADEEAKPEGKPAESAGASSSPGAAAGPRPITLDLAVGLGAFQRHLSYSSDNEYMRPYDIDPAAAAVMAAAELYPGAPSTTGAGAHIGITAAFNTAIGLKSKYKNPLSPAQTDSYSTTSYGYEFGLKYRFPFGTSEVGIAAAYGQQVFSVSLPDQSAMPNMAVPAVSYRYIRPGIAARFGVADGFAIVGGLGYLVVLGAGEMTSDAFFPHASVGGADIDLGVAIELAKHVEVRPSFGYRAYFFSMNHAVGDKFDVGGAFDQYLGLSILLAYRN